MVRVEEPCVSSSVVLARCIITNLFFFSIKFANIFRCYEKIFG